MLTRVFLLFWLCAFMVNGDDNVMTSEELEAYLKTNPNLWESKPLDEDQKSRFPGGGGAAEDQERFRPKFDNETHAEYFNFNFGMVPTDFDSRKQWPNCPSIGAIPDQSSCWSCWAVSMASVASDRLCIQTNGRVKADLSAIDLTSCCTQCGKGCNEGYPQKAWEYFRHQGIVTGGSQVNKAGCKPYPFPECGPRPANGNQWQCSPMRYGTPFCVKSCQMGYGKQYQQDKYYGGAIYNPRNARDMQIEIMQRGPIQVVMDVFDDFKKYKGGVYYHRSGIIKLFSHVVKIIGWGQENGVPYWLGVNSWNNGWGESGTFKYVRGINMCGIEKWAVAGSVDTGRMPGSVGGMLGSITGGFSIADLFKGGGGKSKKRGNRRG